MSRKVNTTRITVRLPEEILVHADSEVAKGHCRTRSEWITRAAYMAWLSVLPAEQRKRIYERMGVKKDEKGMNGE